MKVVLTGGGTGGHIYPAISVGQALLGSDPSTKCLFVGSSHGPEGDLARRAGLDFRAVPSGSLTKSVSLRNAASLGKLALGVFRARAILAEFKPDVVIGTGGYTTAAVLIAQWLRCGPVVIHEQNAVPGRTNLWLARISDRVCVSYDTSAAFFPNSKVVVTGMPIREDFAALPPKSEARRSLGLAENFFTVLVVGGSQGAKKLNDLVLGAWPMIDDGGLQILHQVGERNLEGAQSLDIANARAYHLSAYVDMPPALAAADLVMARSGASTIAEVTAAGGPAILVPYPYAYANHQKLNAEVAASRGAAIICEEHAATSEALADIVRDLRASPERLAAMASVSASLGMPDAAKRVAEVVREAAGC